MMLNLKLVLRAGLIWGIIGIVLIVLVAFFGSSLPFAVEGLNLGTYAVLFAGVYFVSRNKEGKIPADLIGGAISGIIAALLLILAGYVLPSFTGVGTTPSTTAIIGALLAGLAGALGMILTKRL
jgi:hypothetical protein